MSDGHPDAVLYRRLRAESAQLLGLDPASLTTAQGLRVDLVASLRLALDTFTAQQLRGEPVDVGKMLSCAESLERLLPRSASPFNAKAHLDSVRTKFTALIDSYANEFDRVRDVRVAALEAEIAGLKETLAGKDAALAVLSGGAASLPPPAPTAPTAPAPAQTSPQPPLGPPDAPIPRHYLARPSEPGRSWDPIPARSPRNW
jgi:hypothetical protein